MKHRFLGLVGSWRGRSLLGGAVALGAAGVFAMSAFAVHDLSFQLDGDVSASTTTNVGGTTQAVDWDTLFDASGNEKPLPAGFNASGFDRDFLTAANGSFITSDDTTFATGSKDTLPISGWQCNHDANVNSKIDIMNSYATAFTSVTGHQILYFAMERNSNAGDGNVGFWFLQNDVACSTASGTATFSGAHADGDLLIVSAFTNGGAVSTIDVYRWNGGANGSLGTTPVAHGVDCKTTLAADSACATVNGPTNGTGGTITTPWLTSNKQDGPGHSLRTSEFFEGGIDLTASNLGGKCFNEFIADTRSSQSLTATLFDFARGVLGECITTVTTTPKESDGTTTLTSKQIPTSGTLDVKDSLDLSVTGVPSFNGTLKFFLCGPSAANSTSTCDTGGTQIGSTQNVTTSGTYTSAAATITSAGRYCWRGEFSGDSAIGVLPGSDSSATECFVITPVTPHLTTQAGASPVDFGNPVTDTATLSGTANQPGSGGGGSDGSINPTTAGAAAGGSITFTLYKNDCTTLATGTGKNPSDPVSVSGDGTYGPVSFTPDAPGTYHWVATYSGNLPNTTASPASDSVCGADPNEDVVVRQIPTEISTHQRVYPNDSATITSSVAGDNLPSGGSVTFRLYGPAGGNSALENCLAHGDTLNSGGLLYRETNTVGGSHQVTSSTSNTSVAVDSSDTYYWRVTYSTGDTAHTGRQSDCVENTALTFVNDSGPGTLFP